MRLGGGNRIESRHKSAVIEFLIDIFEKWYKQHAEGWWVRVQAGTDSAIASAPWDLVFSLVVSYLCSEELQMFNRKWTDVSSSQ